MSMVQVGELRLCVEDDAEGEPLLMIMGLGAQLVHWPAGLLAELRAQGFRAVRFDNRDAGQSSWLRAAPAPEPWAALAARAAGLPVAAPYRVDDLAADALGLMDRLGLRRVHVLGFSLGGMVAQALALMAPERVRAVASVASSPGCRRHGIPRGGAMSALLAPAPVDRRGAGRRQVALAAALAAPGVEVDAAGANALGELAFDRGLNPAGVRRQLAAVLASGSRRRALAGLAVPALVVHGPHDPLIAASGGRATAAAAPRARLLELPGMGHDLPPASWAPLARALAEVAGA
jgi:pimeloyl-ACP methyl ester carboxylesterase